MHIRSCMIHSEQIACETAEDQHKIAHEVQIWYLAVIGLHMRLQKVASDCTLYVILSACTAGA